MYFLITNDERIQDAHPEQLDTLVIFSHFEIDSR